MNAFNSSHLSNENQLVINEILNSALTAEQKWQKISQQILNPSIPFEIHNQVYHRIYGKSKINYMSFPTADDLTNSYLAKWMKSVNIKSVPDFHQWSCENRAVYWQKVISDLDIIFNQKPESMVDLTKGQCHPKWLPGASYNIVDSILSAEPNKTAIIFADEFGKTNSWTYAELTEKVNQVANGLEAIGIESGDRIAIDMMMAAESVAIYLGIIKCGAEAVSIADSFAVDEIKVRLEAADAKLIFTQDYIDRAGKQIPMYEKVRQAGNIQIVSIMHSDSQTKLSDGDITWNDFLSANTEYASKKFSADKTINVLFSSGTTGAPKAIPWDQTTPIKAASDAKVYLDTNKDDVWVWPTNLGWMMGPWLVFASLLNKATLGLFYGAPNAKEFVEFVTDNKVTKLGVIPSIVKTWRSTGVLDDIDWTGIQAFASTGERSNEEDMRFLSSRANYRPVMEYCGGTEIGGAYLTSTVVQPNMPSAFATPTFGLGVELMNDQGEVLSGSVQGEVALVPPSMGLSLKLLNKDHDKSYYEGMPKHNGEQLRRHGDQMQRFENGYYCSHGRADDTMNLGGIKTSSAEIEHTVNLLDDVYESAAIAIEPQSGGPSLLVIYIVPKNESVDKDNLHKEIQKQIRAHLNPLFKVFDVVLTEKLPRTASNKVMRRSLRDQYGQ